MKMTKPKSLDMINSKVLNMNGRISPVTIKGANPIYKKGEEKNG